MSRHGIGEYLGMSVLKRVPSPPLHSVMESGCLTAQAIL